MIRNQMNKKLSATLHIVASFLLILALLDLPYGYYAFLRLFISFIALLEIVSSYKSRKEINLFHLIVLLLFNPIFIIPLTRNIWIFVDVIIGTIFLIIAIIPLLKSKAL